jgi:hypothetical protein
MTREAAIKAFFMGELLVKEQVVLGIGAKHASIDAAGATGNSEVF